MSRERERTEGEKSLTFRVAEAQGKEVKVVNAVDLWKGRRREDVDAGSVFYDKGSLSAFSSRPTPVHPGPYSSLAAWPGH